MLPEPNFPVKPDEFVGRRQQIEIFRQSLQQGLQAGRTASFAILGDWGISKSCLLLKFAALCSQPPLAMLPVFVAASSDIRDYLRLAEIMLDKFADAFACRAQDTSMLAHRASKLEIQPGQFRRCRLGR